MCGIAGFIRADGAPAELDAIQRMTDAVRHRGPNGAGHFLDGPVALGHRRLSVLDLSEDGGQPMHYADSGLVLTFNGEIYNYIEIREELRTYGYTFHTQTDLEVILAAYLCWGDDCVTRFNGMWSFAIFDRRKKRLFCSRDRFGVKPFYYRVDNKTFAFSSEIRQLLPFGDSACQHGCCAHVSRHRCKRARRRDLLQEHSPNAGGTQRHLRSCYQRVQHPPLL